MADTDKGIDDAVSEARNMKDEAEGTIEHYRNQVGRLQNDVLDSVQEKPLRTLGIAVMIGFALGALWKL